MLVSLLAKNDYTLLSSIFVQWKCQSNLYRSTWKF